MEEVIFTTLDVSKYTINIVGIQSVAPVMFKSKFCPSNFLPFNVLNCLSFLKATAIAPHS